MPCRSIIGRLPRSLMANDQLSKQSKLQLVLLLALGAACGVVAAVASIRAVQLISICVAGCLGIYAGFMISRDRKGGERVNKRIQTGYCTGEMCLGHFQEDGRDLAVSSFGDPPHRRGFDITPSYPAPPTDEANRGGHAKAQS